MNFLALLLPVALERVRRAVRADASIARATSVRGLLNAISGTEEQVLIIDPGLLTQSDVQEFIAACNGQQTIIAYSSVSPESMANSILLARSTNVQFTFAGVHDEPTLLARSLMLVPHAALGAHVVKGLADSFSIIPDQLSETIRSMLLNGGPTSPSALAAAAWMTRRSLDRWIHRAGITSSRLLVGAAQFIRAYRPLVASTKPLTKLAALLGYSSFRTLEKQTRELTGLTAMTLRTRHPTQEWLGAEIVSHLLLSRCGDTEEDGDRTGGSKRLLTPETHRLLRVSARSSNSHLVSSVRTDTDRAGFVDTAVRREPLVARRKI